jgi:DNA-binding response OmpR family regulator
MPPAYQLLRVGSARYAWRIVKRILVVEDDPVSARVLRDLLTAHGYQVTLAKNGPEGLDAFQRDKPSLVLIDVMLPRKNGFEVCFELRRAPHGKATPVILMSAVYTDRQHAERYAQKDLGAYAYLVKPFALSTLLEHVHACIGEA